jgi:hypothetical protein
MATDQVILGGFVLDGWAAPQAMIGGGKQAMTVHKLPGGSRVIDTLGPDDADIPISGQLYDANAYSTCLAIDAMRAAGSQVPLIWGGQFLMVVVAEFRYTVHRYPNLCDYSILCVIASNPAQGILGAIASTVGGMISADLSAMARF